MTPSLTPKHLVIAGGGTGGHLFPGIALAQAIKAADPEVQVTFVGTNKGIEARVIPPLGYALKFLDVQGLKGQGVAGMIKGAMKLPMAGAEAIGLLRELRPTLVVSVGGYAAGPVTMCASVMGIATALLEQNSVPGVTNRALGKVVKRAFLTYEASQEYFPQNRSVLAGNPLRQELTERAQASTYNAHKVTKTKPLRLLILGGSGGSLALNRAIPAALLALPAATKARLSITHQVGGQSGEDTTTAYAQGAGEFASVKVVEFIEDMGQMYAHTDLLICRAGATTIAEVLAFGLPAIYVPFPGAADDHQSTNAMEVVEGGGGLMVPESELEGTRLPTLLTGLMENPQSRANMSAQAARMARPNAAQEIAAQCLALMSME